MPPKHNIFAYSDLGLPIVFTFWLESRLAFSFLQIWCTRLQGFLRRERHYRGYYFRYERFVTSDSSRSSNPDGNTVRKITYSVRSHFCFISFTPTHTNTAYNDDDEADDSDDESPGTLDLVAIATKRLIFEQVEVLPAPNDDNVNDMIASGMSRAHAAAADDIWGGPSLTLNGAVREANKKHNELQERNAALSAAADNMSIAESSNANMEAEEELGAEDDAMGV